MPTAALRKRAAARIAASVVPEPRRYRIWAVRNRSSETSLSSASDGATRGRPAGAAGPSRPGWTCRGATGAVRLQLFPGGCVFVAAGTPAFESVGPAGDPGAFPCPPRHAAICRDPCRRRARRVRVHLRRRHLCHRDFLRGAFYHLIVRRRGFRFGVPGGAWMCRRLAPPRHRRPCLTQHRAGAARRRGPLDMKRFVGASDGVRRCLPLESVDRAGHGRHRKPAIGDIAIGDPARSRCPERRASHSRSRPLSPLPPSIRAMRVQIRADGASSR